VTTTRYLLDSDDDGHWYLIPATGHEAFHSWVYSVAEAPEHGIDVPDGVISLGSHPNTVTFEAPEHFGEAVA
jgi:hypothetical protein